MTNREIEQLITRHGVISDQVDRGELLALLDELARVLSKRDGAVVEFGCYVGTTSLYIRRVMNTLKSSGEFHVYDSFEGLPEKTYEDESPLGLQFKAGELMAGKKAFAREFQKANLLLPIVHKAWFEDLMPDDVPDNIVFAFLDGDYYGSIKTSLNLIAAKLVTGAVIVVDDYGNEALPGAKHAVDEWCKPRGYKVVVSHSLAIIRT